MITTSYLEDIAGGIKQQFITDVGNSLPITKSVVQAVNEQHPHVATVRKVVLDGEVTHYVASIDTSVIRDIETNNKYTFVDATVSQFSVENYEQGLTDIQLGAKEELPAIGIYPPSAVERSTWYE